MGTSSELLCVECDDEITGLVPLSASAKTILIEGELRAWAPLKYRRLHLFAFGSNSSMVPFRSVVLC